MAANNGSLTIHSVNLMPSTGWVRILNLWELWNQGNEIGANTAIAGQAGRTAEPFVLDEFVQPLEMVVFGHVKYDGSAMSNKIQGLETNFRYLKAQFAPATSYSATLTYPTAATSTTNVQVRSLKAARTWGPDSLRVSMIVTVLAGTF